MPYEWLEREVGESLEIGTVFAMEVEPSAESSTLGSGRNRLVRRTGVLSPPETFESPGTGSRVHP